MINATIKVRAISESAFEAIMALLLEEAKDVRVETWPSGDGADFTPRVIAGRVASEPIYREPPSGGGAVYGRSTSTRSGRT